LYRLRLWVVAVVIVLVAVGRRVCWLATTKLELLELKKSKNLSTWLEFNLTICGEQAKEDKKCYWSSTEKKVH
jgi:hypothetical protein